MKKAFNQALKPIRNRRGQGLTEYIILVVLVAIVSIGTVKTLGNRVKTKMGDAHRQIDRHFPDFSG